MFKRIINFIKTDVWKMPLDKLPRKKSFLIRELRIFLLALKGFDEDKCQLRASALTFYSLLSIVPVVAMVFGIAKGFGFEKMLQEQIMNDMSSHKEVLLQVLDFANSMLENTKGGLIAGVGVVVLFWSVMKVLGNIEESFNDIWEIKASRTLVRKFTDYLAIMLVAPLLMILSSSITVYISTQITQITESIRLLGYFSPLIEFLLQLLPYCLVWLLLTLIYMVMPNTKVKFRSALIAGVIAGTLFQVVQWAYITFQIGVGQYNAIYGSFAALPLFLVWLQISWIIVLFGAEISFANQNINKYEFEAESLQISASYKKLISLLIAHAVVRNFSDGNKPLTGPEISRKLEIPIRLVRQIIYEMMECRIFSETRSGTETEPGYQPARSENGLTISFVLESLENRGVDDLPLVPSDEQKTLAASLASFREIIEQSSANKLLKDI